MDLQSLEQIISEHEIQAVDLKYTGLDGKWYHITFPARRLKNVLQRGIPFDGSSIPGMKSVESSDMVLMPDIDSAHIDPFYEAPTLRMLCTICDAESRIGIHKDPRSVAQRAHKYMQGTGIADSSTWIPELEYHLLDTAQFYSDTFSSGYDLSSSECKESLPDDFDDLDGLSRQGIKGYHADTPFDRFYEVRQEMVDHMEKLDIKIRYHHHEAGLSSQQEIETELLAFPKVADDIMVMKDIIRRTALKHALTATFMPKPIYNHAGNGMHFHMLLLKDGQNIFYQKGGYADLSPQAIWFIGGILFHGRALVALTNPSTNSFKRLLPGFEAPVKLFYGLANRSAAIRIPKYANTPASKRFEFRTGDGSCNPYLAMSAILLAGLDGIKNKIDPADHNFGPFDDNIFAWGEERKATLLSIPADLKEAMQALEEDHKFLLAGDVFDEDLIQSHIKMKMAEYEAINARPHPHEMLLYYNL